MPGWYSTSSIVMAELVATVSGMAFSSQWGEAAGNSAALSNRTATIWLLPRAVNRRAGRAYARGCRKVRHAIRVDRAAEKLGPRRSSSGRQLQRTAARHA